MTWEDKERRNTETRGKQQALLSHHFPVYTSLLVIPKIPMTTPQAGIIVP